MLKTSLVLFIVLFASQSQSAKIINPKFWLTTCPLSGCTLTFNACLGCYGERNCKSCITSIKPECATCADDIFAEDGLETINENKYLLCDANDSFQVTVCHFHCRGRYYQTGKCTRLLNFPICECLSTTTSTIQTIISNSTSNILTTEYPGLNFDGNLNMNIPILNGYQRVFALPNGDFIRATPKFSIEVWDAQNGFIRQSLVSNYYKPIVFGLLSNGDLVAGYSFNRTLVVWDLAQNNEKIKRIIQTDEFFWCLTVMANDDLAIGQQSNNYDIVIRDSMGGQVKKRLVGHTKIVYQMLILPNGNLVSCSLDKKVIVWDIGSGAIVRSLENFSPVYSIAVLSDGNLVSSLNDGSVNIWNLKTWRLEKNFKMHSSGICWNSCLLVLANGDLLSGSYDGTVKVWDPYSQAIKFSSDSHKSTVYQLVVTSLGNIVSSSATNLLIWG
ncbi:NACHT and WD domain [Brachionus plicatilis]|uniref:NACHT and WD domain n=1 Tax=Brachionus plicatilis TaxID=10195 RepID=A0A3M7Q5N9_BRAPC|nr:NACHT and WD domain [Brachionus plicatilis]